jgi:predicted nucleic acid-binding protein
LPRRIVTDSCLWVDLEKGGLTAEAFKIGVEFVASDVVIDELTEPNGQDLVAYGLRSAELSGMQIIEAIELRKKYSGPGTTDLLVLKLASIEKTTLLTSNRHLREAAEKEGVQVHGTLWLLDRMVEQKVISPKRAYDALATMLESGRRLPKEECAKRLKRWQGR